MVKEIIYMNYVMNVLSFVEVLELMSIVLEVMMFKLSFLFYMISDH